jgi:hypothetical protein
VLSINVENNTKAFFRASTRWQVGDGATILFWSDNSLEGNGLREMAPNMVAAVSRRAIKTHRLALAMVNHAWIADITRALSIPVLVQYLELRQQLDQVLLQVGTQDRLEWRWLASAQFSTQSAYQAMFLCQFSVLGAKELWKIKALGKCLFFKWQVLLSRCCTSEHLQHHGMENNGPCALCSQEEECLGHICS